MPLPIGSRHHLGSFDATIHAFGHISDLDTPDMVEYSIEGFGPNAVLDVSVIQGEPGPPGSNAPLGQRMYPVLNSVEDLPQNLTDDPVDIGKYWIIRVFDEDENEIGSNWAEWNGTDFEVFKMGMPGQVGPVPKITPVYRLVTEEEAEGWSSIDQGNGYRTTKTGSDASPTWTHEINREILRGPAGVGSEWNLYTTDDDTEEIGAVPVWDGEKFAPVVQQHPVPKGFSYPEGHFASVGLAIGTRITIGTCLIPPIDWDTVPWVSGRFRLTGIEFDTTPFIIGVEVRLGSPTGQVVARGYGNITGYVDLGPHFSTAFTPNDAVTPDNGRAVIPAGATGNAATLFVNAYNDGAAGIYSFDAGGAQLAALMLPV